MEELYISDLDGTLLNSSGVLSHKSIETLNSLIENGLNFTIATARSLDSAKPLIEKLQLKLPMVLYNGVLVYDPTLKANIHENFIAVDYKEFILECFEKEGLEPIVFTLNKINSPSAFYRNISNAHMETYIGSRLARNDSRFKQVENFKIAISQKVITIISIGNKEALLAVKNRIEATVNIEIHFAEDVYYKGAYWLELAAPNSSKKGGVSFLKNHLNPEKIICFGDNLNDISMFEVADEKYATSNAREELKAIATEVIGKNNDDAVARFLQNRSQINNL